MPFQKGHQSFLTEESKRKMSLSKKGNKWNVGKKHSLERIKTRSQKLMGRKMSAGTRKKISDKAKERVKNGEHNFGDGTKTIKRLAIYNSLEYKLWRKSIFERDKWTCIWCNQKGGKLQADHIKPFAYFPELRFAIDNGRTLCINCHRKTDTYGSGAKKYNSLESMY